MRFVSKLSSLLKKEDDNFNKSFLMKDRNKTEHQAMKEVPEYYDGISTLLEPNKLGQGPLKPVGVTIHYSADRNLKRVHKTLKESGLGYHLLIDRDGSCVQIAPFNEKVWHAGKAKWQEFSPNHNHIAVSLLSWGKLKVRNGIYKSWSGEEIKASEVAHRSGNVSLAQEWWDKATDEQFDALMTFCKWVCRNGISPQAVCGHDECALPHGRKIDPGGVLPVSMARFREMLDMELVKDLRNV